MVRDPILLLPALLAFAAVAFATIAVVLLSESIAAGRRRRDVMRRLRGEMGEGDPLASNLVRASDADAPTRLERVLASVPRFRDARRLLQQAGLEWTAQTYVLLTLGSALAFGTAVLLIWNVPLFALFGAAGGALLPDLFVRYRKRKRLRRFEEQFPDSVDLLGRAIRAGHPLSSGIRMVAEEAPEPNAGTFRQVFEEQRFGLPFEDALLGMADRIDLVDVRIFVTAVLVQRDVGGNLAEILDKIAQTVRARFTIRRQLRVYTAQGRLSGYVLAALPIVMAVAIYFLDAEYALTLYNESIGRIMVAGAITMQILGYLWIRRIVNIEI
jgi:tight adherence protein B